jgi:formylglycine-generating enzyme required for sulfatase activity
MRRFLWIALAAIVAALSGAPAAYADKRVALVIGNAQYVHEGRLDNPGNDARAVGAALKRIRFDDVEVVLDADLIAMQRALAGFARKADGADVALIYYSGHGVEVDGKNYLIPVSASLTDAGDADFEAVALDQALLAADRARKVKIVVLDACRDNPFRVRMVRAAKQGSRSVGRGLAVPGVAATGMLVAYAARAGSVADDGPKGANSPFTAAFLRFVESPRVDVRIMLGRVRDEVVRATGRQEPFTYGSLGGEEVFLNAAGVPSADPGPQSAEAKARERLALQRQEELRKAEEAARREPALSVRPGSGESFRDCEACPEMVVVPAGSFTMGSSPQEIAALKKEYTDTEHLPDREGPQHRVSIARPFAVGKFEVTFGEWDACMAERGCTTSPDDRGWGRNAKRPVINVSWDDITEEYLPWLNRKTGKTYRLLTEAEWEYAARAGTTTRYAFGDTIDKSQARYKILKPGAIGTYPPNAFGLYDMHGNVEEWAQDCWSETYENAPSDGSARTTGDCTLRVMRGGSWSPTRGPEFLRSAFRGPSETSNRLDVAGFRVGRTLAP